MINVSVLVLRSDEVDSAHFRAPTFIPVVGAGVSLALMGFETEGVIALKALILLTVGAVLFALTWSAGGQREAYSTEELAAVTSG